MKTIELDIRGQVCPSCLLMVLREVNQHYHELETGELSIVVLTDNRHATGTVPEAVNSMGISADVVKDNSHYRITIEQ